MSGVLQKMGMKEGEPVYDRWISKALEKAQQKVEERNFDVRKNLLKFDNVMNDQRKVIYEQRRELMETTDLSDVVADFRADIVSDMVTRCIPPGSFAEHWDVKALHEETRRLLALDLPVESWAKEDGIADTELKDRLARAADEHYAAKAARFTPQLMRIAEKSILLQILDQSWKEHLLALDHLRQGIGLRGFGQRDPLNEYRREAFEMFGSLLDHLREQVTQTLMKLEIRITSPDAMMPPPRRPQEMQELRPEPAMAGPHETRETATSVTPLRKPAFSAADESTWGDTPRNNACPCGSGKKFKHCHGRF
jgi:preprotein translocase subunit SecA